MAFNLDKMNLITKKLMLPVLFFCLPFLAVAQTTTKNEEVNEESGTIKKAKILLIPWEPRMYNCNSGISRAIATETSQKFDQIQESLRKGMVSQTKKAFGNAYTVLSLIDDTAKMKGDLYYAYTRTTMSYTPVTFPLNPTKADSAKLKQQAGVKNGQIAVQSDDVEKFMNTIVLSPDLLGYFKKKYNVDYILFFNEIDIENDFGLDPYNLQGKVEFNRNVNLHWTIFNVEDGKRVAMGKSNGKFLSSANSPKAIVEGAFKNISKSVFDKFALGIIPKK